MGVDDAGRLRARVAAPPVEGAANDALVRLVARELGLGRTAVRIDVGGAARTKRLRVAMAAEAVAARWPGLAVDG